jgi:predicted nucleotidyltransferase component of viral defense system
VISREAVLAAATELALSPDVVEKDYVLGWILAGIFKHAELSGTWLLKGGTCLKKCYFETYRFSEDLDFTLLDPDHLDEQFLQRTLGEVADWVHEASGIVIPKDRFRFRLYTNPRGALSCEGRVYYNGPLQRRPDDLPRVKLDLLADELIALEPVDRPISHPYTDRPDVMTARCYAYSELMAEKLRALGERTRPRDLYDVINLFRNERQRPPADTLVQIVRRKCESRGLAIPSLGALISNLNELRADWAAMLEHQLPSLPPFDAFWSALPEVFGWLETGATPVAPAAAPARPGENVFIPSIGSMRDAGIPSASHLEIIRFAASNRLCVDLLYDNGCRRIEPYSLRRTIDGNVLLYAVRADSGEARSYRVDRIQGATVTDQSFTPRFAIELTQTGFNSMHEIARTPVPRKSITTRKKNLAKLIYVYECYYCGKKFHRTTRSTRLNAHKDRSGYACSGRTAHYVETIYP